MARDEAKAADDAGLLSIRQSTSLLMLNQTKPVTDACPERYGMSAVIQSGLEPPVSADAVSAMVIPLPGAMARRLSSQGPSTLLGACHELQVWRCAPVVTVQAERIDVGPARVEAS